MHSGALEMIITLTGKQKVKLLTTLFLFTQIIIRLKKVTGFKQILLVGEEPRIAAYLTN